MNTRKKQQLRYDLPYTIKYAHTVSGPVTPQNFAFIFWYSYTRVAGLLAYKRSLNGQPIYRKLPILDGTNFLTDCSFKSYITGIDVVFIIDWVQS
jgi:hypothetical protein